MTGSHTSEKRTWEIRITGLVQGVGFRPFVYRTAIRHGIAGWVNNTNAWVGIRATASEPSLRAFLHDLETQAPPAAAIDRIELTEIPYVEFPDFRIAPSEDHSDQITRVSPDIAVCEDCLEDMARQPNRIGYPFLNCTNCGPRFTIISDLPYDRQRTTMSEFTMCPSCRKEYNDVGDRRFHAQPTACWDCGPVYTLCRKGQAEHDITVILREAAAIIEGGGILAVKGMGGYHLACNALDEQAVAGLRKMKQREAKPFAVMFRDLEALQSYARPDKTEVEALLSWRRPIVLLKAARELAPSVSNGFHTIGSMLPYMPFHYLLFGKLKTPVIVLTSGNLSDEPILIGNAEARRIMGPLTSGILEYNREIRNRTDDSVVMVSGETQRIIRRSRGFVPNPVITSLRTEGIFAAGAELVNCFAIGKGRQAILSQHIGDLKNSPSYDFYRESVDRFFRLFRLKPERVACDLHPDYLSTVFARELEQPLVMVQHHHAHMASVMAEHGLAGPCLGICYDGTGYGTDGHTWGGEFLLGDLAGFERLAHFRYVPMPGGDAVTHEPWRMALSYLDDAFGEETPDLRLPWYEGLEPAALALLLQAIRKGFNAPLSSSAGRLFDAVSALLGVCTRSRFHAEAPMRLEDLAGKAGGKAYSWTGGEIIDFRPMIREMVQDIHNGEPAAGMAARFHRTLIGMTLATVERILAGRLDIPVLLSGGSFQNRILLEGVESGLRDRGISCYSNLQVPVNDGGIALGQLAVAAARREAGLF